MLLVRTPELVVIGWASGDATLRNAAQPKLLTSTARGKPHLLRIRLIPAQHAPDYPVVKLRAETEKVEDSYGEQDATADSCDGRADRGGHT